MTLLKSKIFHRKYTFSKRKVEGRRTLALKAPFGINEFEEEKRHRTQFRIKRV